MLAEKEEFVTKDSDNEEVDDEEVNLDECIIFRFIFFLYLIKLMRQVIMKASLSWLILND